MQPQNPIVLSDRHSVTLTYSGGVVSPTFNPPLDTIDLRRALDDVEWQRLNSAVAALLAANGAPLTTTGHSATT